MLDVRVRMYLYRWNMRGAEDTVGSDCESYSMHVRSFLLFHSPVPHSYPPTLLSLARALY